MRPGVRAPLCSLPSVTRAPAARARARAQDDFEFQQLYLGEERLGAGADDAELAQVDFKVDFVQKGTLNLMVLCEKSTFRRDAASSAWLYAQGDVEYEAQSVQLTEEQKAELQEKHRQMQEAGLAAQ